MAITISDNFYYGGKKPNFVRDQFKTLEELNNFSTNFLDDGHISFCIETRKHYIWDDKNSIWKELGQTNLSDNFNEKEYREFNNENVIFTALTKGDSYENAISTLEDNLILLVNETSDSEVVISAALSDLQENKLDVKYLDELNNSIDSLNSSVSSLRTSASTLNSSVSSLKTSASTLNSSVSSLRTSKQDKLTAGNNITINSNNVISCDIEFSPEISNDYSFNVYPDTENEEVIFSALTAGTSYEKSFNILEDNIVLLTTEVLNNEAVISQAITDLFDVTNGLTEIKDKINILYKLDVTFSGGGNFKKGTTANGTLKWTVKVNGVDVNPNKQELNGNVIEDNTVRSSGYSVTENTTFTLKVDDITKTQNVAFYNPTYYGVVGENYVVSNSISGLTEVTDQYGSFKDTFTLTSNSKAKFVYLYPKAFGNVNTIYDGNNFNVTNSFIKITENSDGSALTINNEQYVAYILKEGADINNITFKFT